METKTVYKLFKKRKDGTLGSLFINCREKYNLNSWMTAQEYPTKGYKFRPYWHCTFNPEAPHLTTKGRVWCKVEIKDYIELARPASQGGVWLLAKQLKILKEL